MKFKIKINDVIQSGRVTLLVGEVNKLNYLGKIRNGEMILDIVGTSNFVDDKSK